MQAVLHDEALLRFVIDFMQYICVVGIYVQYIKGMSDSQGFELTIFVYVVIITWKIVIPCYIVCYPMLHCLLSRVTLSVIPCYIVTLSVIPCSLDLIMH